MKVKIGDLTIIINKMDSFLLDTNLHEQKFKRGISKIKLIQRKQRRLNYGFITNLDELYDGCYRCQGGGCENCGR